MTGASLWTLVPALIATNYAQGLKRALGVISSGSGSRHARMPDVKASLSYIDGVFTDYARYVPPSAPGFQNAAVLEIGPGDNFGVALQFLTHGASRVTCLDKYFSARDPVRQKNIYEALRARLDPAGRAIFDRALPFADGRLSPGGEILGCVYGVGIEEAVSVLPREGFDFIVSRAVIEHVRDARAAFLAMDTLLKPGGIMLHKIDFRDHGLFSGGKRHPLTFLTLPSALYRHVALASGRPNRALVPNYRGWLCELGYEAGFYVTHVLGGSGDPSPYVPMAEASSHFDAAARSLVKEIRPRLATPFSAFSDEDLMVTGAFIVARKPLRTGAKA